MVAAKLVRDGVAERFMTRGERLIFAHSIFKLWFNLGSIHDLQEACWVGISVSDERQLLLQQRPSHEKRECRILAGYPHCRLHQ
jgi:hypothetical protein